jgi:glutamate formiminotransferase
VARRLMECVANFSEGRSSEAIDAIQSPIGGLLLDRTMDADHNRSVLTFAGPPEEVAEAAVRAVGKAAELIDLTMHKGVHPRIGAADVVPFVPLEGISLEECARLAVAAGNRIWHRFGVPVYLYEAAARRPENVRLENIRRGQFEGLREEVKSNPVRRPDIGGPLLHPTAGATVLGARKFLIAFNVNLATADLSIAQSIARKIRQSSGGFPCVKALGIMLRSHKQAQVSMNLTDFEVTPLNVVIDAVERESALLGTSIDRTELIGLIPQRAVDPRITNLTPDSILEKRLMQIVEA